MKPFDNYEDVAIAMKQFFTQITDINSQRFEEFNNTYKIQELAEAKTTTLAKVKMNKALNKKGHFLVESEAYFYDKAPKGIVISLCLFWLDKDKKCPIGLNLFIDERGI